MKKLKKKKKRNKINKISMLVESNSSLTDQLKWQAAEAMSANKMWREYKTRLNAVESVFLQLSAREADPIKMMLIKHGLREITKATGSE